jgi:hypothetical protein
MRVILRSKAVDDPHILGCPTYGLTDNEKTVTTEHVAGVAIRNPAIVAAGQHYGLTIKTCRVADPESKGGSEATVRVAKADLVPRDTNLLPAYGSFAQLEIACLAFCEMVNARPHRVTRRPPVEMLAEERTRLHPVPEHPHTVAFGLTRTVGNTTPMIGYEGGSYSVPDPLAGKEVWVRSHGDDIVIVHVGPAGPVEVARHLRTTPGNPRADDAHFPVRQSDPLQRTPSARTPAEVEFLSLGAGAGEWLMAAGEAGASRVRVKMATAVQLARIVGAQRVSLALGHAAVMGRFAEGDLASIIDHQAIAKPGDVSRASEDHSLQAGTAAWAVLGR